MKPTHYDLFTKLVKLGVFDDQSIGSYVRDVQKRVKYFASPIGSEETEKAFGLERGVFCDYMHAFIERALVNNKALPLDSLVCVEDELSAVFVENDPKLPKSLRIMTFMDTRQEDILFDSILCYGLLELAWYTRETNTFAASQIYALNVVNQSAEPVEEETLPIVGQNLVESAITISEQLAYMEKEGIITETKRMLN